VDARFIAVGVIK